MERSGAFSPREIVAISTAAAAAFGGLVTALSRAQQRGVDGEGDVRADGRQAETVESAALARQRARFAAAARTVSASSRERLVTPEMLARALSEISSAANRGLTASTPHAATATDGNVAPDEFFDQGTNNDRVRDTVVAVAAIGVVSGALYLALRSESIRRRLTDSLCQLIERIQLLTDDFRGYDEGY